MGQRLGRGWLLGLCEGMIIFMKMPLPIGLSMRQDNMGFRLHEGMQELTSAQPIP